MATYTATPVTEEMRDHAALLASFHPAFAKVSEGLMEIAEQEWTADQTSTAIALIGGVNDGVDDLLALIAAVARRLGDPATNPALRDLTPSRAHAVRSLTRQYEAYDRDFAPRSLLAEAAAAADLDCPHPTDHA
ncbi:hypothetical protein [Streptomyces angustmyceticus]|uniref:hypothetical protein n=1 Tax=Streptomyces angustmyceticus TaxID=285578 RepID=UPI00344D32D6